MYFITLKSDFLNNLKDMLNVKRYKDNNQKEIINGKTVINIIRNVDEEEMEIINILRYNERARKSRNGLTNLFSNLKISRIQKS